MLYTTTISSTLFYLMNPYIVYRTYTSIVDRFWRIWIWYWCAINHTGIIKPIHMFITDAWCKISILLNCIIYTTTVQLTTSYTIFYCEVILWLALTSYLVFDRYCLWNRWTIYYTCKCWWIHKIICNTYTCTTLIIHIWRTSTFVYCTIPYKTRKTITLCLTFLSTNWKRYQLTVKRALSFIKIPTPIISTVTFILPFSYIQTIFSRLTIYDTLFHYKIIDISIDT